ncbi:hypothetical protein CNYM01_00906 [Colletotrichum nymphaeae SA-01]|uniref:BZIP domain-containing protein n=1 Tax=Colletotrichum nymphaeae SA-01 TaxID=1460502 RepID=A0A135UY51_9PEZI|nr:hypothetical protein CNYM01_00906 [Colletotrichum nymphaeae SA-01]
MLAAISDDRASASQQGSFSARSSALPLRPRNTLGETDKEELNKWSRAMKGEEDWTKSSDLAERRRIQNRIAQRNYRKKLKRRLEDLEKRACDEGQLTPTETSSSSKYENGSIPFSDLAYLYLSSSKTPKPCNISPLRCADQELSFSPIADDSEDKSSSPSETSEVAPIYALPSNHRFRSIEKLLVEDCLSNFLEWQTCPQNSNKRTANPPATQTQRSSKRSRKDDKSNDKNDNEGNGGNEEGEDSNANIVSGSTMSPSNKSGSIILACPFYKEDPLKHLQCLRIELKRIKDVKQHLNRKHRQPSYYCPTCWMIFDKPTDRDIHISQRGCSLQDQVNYEGISEDQSRQLTRKVDRRLSEEQQWFSVWDIVFPDVPRPESAYLGNQIEESMVMIHDYWDANGKALVFDALWERGLIPEPNVSDDDGELESFLAETLESVVEELLASCRMQIAASLSRSSRNRYEASSAPERAPTSESSAKTQSYDTSEQDQRIVDLAHVGESALASGTPVAQESVDDYSFLTGLDMVGPLAGHEIQSILEGSQFSMSRSWSTREEGIAEFDDQSWELLADVTNILQAERP